MESCLPEYCYHLSSQIEEAIGYQDAVSCVCVHVCGHGGGDVVGHLEPIQLTASAFTGDCRMFATKLGISFTFHIWKVGCRIIKAVLLMLQLVEGPFCKHSAISCNYPEHKQLMSSDKFYL